MARSSEELSIQQQQQNQPSHQAAATTTTPTPQSHLQQYHLQQQQQQIQLQLHHQHQHQASTTIKQENNNNNNNNNNNSDHESSYQAAGDNNKPKRNPFCSRCRNHGKSAQVKGHKRHCEYRDCQCDGCRLVEARQLVSAAQIKRRRYQKQDEECGRRIEVSPPVLKRARLTSDDPAAMITNGLLRQLPHLQQQPPQQPPTSAQPSLHAHQLQLQSQHPHQQQQLKSQLHLSAAAASGACLKPGGNHLIGGGRLLESPNQTAAAASSSASLALSNALHLFHYQHHSPVSGPGSGLNPMASLSAAVAAAAAASNSSATTSPLPPASAQIWSMRSPPLVQSPSPRDQMLIVMDLFNSFGPLAIFAWLKAEHFNLAKVRDIIELSKSAFDEITGHSPLDLTNPIVD